jgi:hypothetical protein
LWIYLIEANTGRLRREKGPWVPAPATRKEVEP